MVNRKAIASMSLGRASKHDFRRKLDAAQKYGFEGIELFYEDLETLADNYPGGKMSEGNHVKAAKDIRQLCDERNITVICLQPFYGYEGLVDRSEHALRIEKLHFWFQLCQILGTDLIQIPSSFLAAAEITSDIDTIVSDFREAVDLGLTQNPPIRFAYESLSFGTYVDTWEQCWDIIARVDRPNFGICLDTFNIAARVYGDPASPDCTTPNAENDIQASMQRLLEVIDVNKVFYIQVVDAERLSAPLIEGHEFYDEAQPPRMSWSRNCRLFYGEVERGAFLPVQHISRAIFQGLGYDGWVSMEYFNRDLTSPQSSMPEQLARRADSAWRKLVIDMKLETRDKLQRVK